jgi:hypothetical protein
MSKKLNDERLREIAQITIKFLKSNSAITNRKLREISGLEYDQAIFFFNHMLRTGRLKRIGVCSGIKYVLP